MTGPCGDRTLSVSGCVRGTTPTTDVSNDQRREETIVENVGGERVSSSPLVGQASKRRGDIRLIDRTIGQGLH
jgi:hypothetical protein